MISTKIPQVHKEAKQGVKHSWQRIHTCFAYTHDQITQQPKKITIKRSLAQFTITTTMRLYLKIFKEDLRKYVYHAHELADSVT